MQPIVAAFLREIICSVDFIYFKLLTGVTYFLYSIFEYFIGPAWNCSHLRIYWIK